MTLFLMLCASTEYKIGVFLKFHTKKLLKILQIEIIFP